MATEGSAVQYMAVKLVELPALEARMALVGEVSPLVQAVLDGITTCHMREDPLFVEVFNSCDRLQKFLEYYEDWYTQQAAMPLEFCIPEPDLFSMAELHRMDPFMAPPWLARIHTSMGKVRSSFKGQPVATKTAWTDACQEVAEAMTALAASIQWPMMRTLGRDLGQVMFEIGWPSVYHL